jgi:hypothetical protein
VSDLPWSPDPQHWRQPAEPPPYQGEPSRVAGNQLSDPEPPGGSEPPGGAGPPPSRRNRHAVRNILAGIGILAVVGLVVSALQSKGTGASTPASRTSSSAVSPVSSAPAQATSVAISSAAPQPTGPGQIGSSFDVQDGSGDTYQVTLLKVVDPGKNADQFVTLQHGSRLVGIEFRISALAGSPQGEDADNDCTIVGTDGRDYTANFDSIVGYTNFEVGVIHVAEGRAVVGVVTFELPQFVKVEQVLWASSDGLGSPVKWHVDA